MSQNIYTTDMITYYYGIDGSTFEVKCEEHNTHISASYRLKKPSDMRALLESHRETPAYAGLAITKRSVFSMIMEWRSHNLLYSLGIARSRTGSADLDYPQKWYYKVAYFMLGCLYPHW